MLRGVRLLTLWKFDIYRAHVYREREGEKAIVTHARTFHQNEMFAHDVKTYREDS